MITSLLLFYPSKAILPDMLGKTGSSFDKSRFIGAIKFCLYNKYYRTIFSRRRIEGLGLVWF